MKKVFELITLVKKAKNVVKNCSIPDVSSSCEWCGSQKENPNGLFKECGRFPSPSNYR